MNILYPLLKNGIRTTGFYSVASWKPVYFAKVRWVDTRSMIGNHDTLLYRVA